MIARFFAEMCGNQLRKRKLYRIDLHERKKSEAASDEKYRKTLTNILDAKKNPIGEAVLVLPKVLFTNHRAKAAQYAAMDDQFHQ